MDKLHLRMTNSQNLIRIMTFLILWSLKLKPMYLQYMNMLHKFQPYCYYYFYDVELGEDELDEDELDITTSDDVDIS